MENEDKKIEHVNRYDVAPLETKFETTPEGFLQGSAIVTRTGVFTYLNPDGTYRYELRLPEEVFKQDALETLKLKPITNDHPTVGKVNAENVTKFGVGSTGSNTRNDSENLAIDFVITDAKTIREVKAGKRELSCGYTCDTIEEEGFWNGEKYTHIQRNISYNHVAVVRKARAGSVARIRMDGALAPIQNEHKENGMEDNLKTINLDSVDYQAEAKVIEVLQSYKAKSEETQLKLDTAINEKTTVEAERDALKANLDAVKEELEALKKVHVDSADVQKIVRERVALEGFASKIGVEFKQDQADSEIMKAVVAKQFPKVNQERIDADETYLRAMYDIAVEQFNADADADAETRKVNETKTDGADKPVDFEAKRKAYVERLRNAHKVEK